jgi:TPR repeat protein
MYATGEGVKKNKKEAKKWLTIAAQNGIDAAEQILREL